MPSRSVILQESAVVVDGRRIPLFSGEIHYWRIFRERWRTALQSMKEMGLQGVGVYIPWYDCEIAPGDWDFTGRTAPQRDMAGFLELCAEMDMWVLFRPGPYIYAEVRNLGVPDRAAPYHRLHPGFLKMARAYMEAVTEAARLSCGSPTTKSIPPSRISKRNSAWPESPEYSSSGWQPGTTASAR